MAFRQVRPEDRPCVHRGGLARKIDGADIFRCARHGQCSLGFVRRGIKTCIGCPDRREGSAGTDEWKEMPIAAPADLPEPKPVPTDHPFQIIVKSFRRFAALRRLIESIKRHYPEASILVADDSFESVPKRLPPDAQAVASTSGVRWLQLPFDVGLAAGRNYAVACATAPVVINFDDDYVVTQETRLDKFLQVLDHDRFYDVVCGIVRQDGVTAGNWCGRFRFIPMANGTRHLRIEPLTSEWEATGGREPVRYRQTDLGWNFFAARRDALLASPYDNKLKIVAEHLDNFLGFWREGVRVCYTPDVIVGHLPERPAGYAPYRHRDYLFRYLVRKWNLSGRPNHRWSAEPGIEDRDTRAMLDEERALDPPNIVVLTPGHTGSSVATAMLHRLGWYGPSDVDEYAESPGLRRLSEKRLSEGRWSEDDQRQAARSLAELPRPWAVKDPRFCETMDVWRPVFEPYRPMLLWIDRDESEIRQSYTRRRESLRRCEERIGRCRVVYRAWPWGKMRLDYGSQLRAAAGLFRVDPPTARDGVA